MNNYNTEIYFFVDELLKILSKKMFWEKLPKWNPYNKGIKKSLFLSEIITLNIIAVLGHFSDLKVSHRNASLYLKKDFPKLTNYENYLKATNQSLPYLMIYLTIIIKYYKILFKKIKKIC